MKEFRGCLIAIVVAFGLGFGVIYGGGALFLHLLTIELDDPTERHSFYVEKRKDDKGEPREVVLYSIANYKGYTESINNKGVLNEQRIHDAIVQMKMKHPDADEIIVTGIENGFRDVSQIGGHYRKENPDSFLYIDHGWERKKSPRYQKEIKL